MTRGQCFTTLRRDRTTRRRRSLGSSDIFHAIGMMTENTASTHAMISAAVSPDAPDMRPPSKRVGAEVSALLVKLLGREQGAAFVISVSQIPDHGRTNGPRNYCQKNDPTLTHRLNGRPGC